MQNRFEHISHLQDKIVCQIVWMISDWFIKLSKAASNTWFGLFATVSEYFALRTLSTIGLSILYWRIVDPCSQSPNMHPPQMKLPTFSFSKVCLNWYWQKATYIYFVDNIWGKCSLSRYIVIVPTIWNTFLLSTISFVIVPIIWNRISFFPGLSVPCRRRNWIVLEQGRTIDFILFYFCILGFLVFN